MTKRTIVDRLSTIGVTLGGISVIAAVLLILVYLFLQVVPLLLPASLDERADFVPSGPAWERPALLLVLDEYGEIGMRLDNTGELHFFRADTGEGLLTKKLVSSPVTAFTHLAPHLVLGTATGEAVVVEYGYDISYPQGVRRLQPRIGYPLGQGLSLSTGSPLDAVALMADETELLLVGIAGADLRVSFFVSEESLYTSEPVWGPDREFAVQLATIPSRLMIDGRRRWLLGLVDDTRLAVYDLEADGKLHSLVPLVDAGRKVTALGQLLGGVSLLVGDNRGGLSQWFFNASPSGETTLTRVREFENLDAGAVRDIVAERRHKGFAVLADGGMGLYHSTANNLLLAREWGGLQALAISDRGERLLLVRNSSVDLFDLDNEHPEISLSTIWEAVWYEFYTEPDYIWQSSAANTDFEPKFSLVPLSFGTLKAAFYAMLFAAPLAVAGAVYTAYFMRATLRRKIKPLIELMQALPTTILGFIAGLFLAPVVERNLPGVFMMLVMLPLIVIAVSLLWSKMPTGWRKTADSGWSVGILIPFLVAMSWGCLLLSAPVEQVFFGGNMPGWIENSLGIGYDQRNALIVGLAMGFAVIPTIFSIAEDAVFGVPRHLIAGSLAMGANAWQTMVRVVLPTAMPGIFSALMIGMGRAIGETMIVLMATGNTPILDWNIFEGMRTLSANIAVEMPESEVGSSHYHMLFLCAFVLFIFTFVINTGAEIVRQRLWRRYGNL